MSAVVLWRSCDIVLAVEVSREPLPFRVGKEEHEGTRWSFAIDGRGYVAEIRRGSGVGILNGPDDTRADIEALADYLMAEDGIRFVYYRHKQLRPRRREAPRPLREEEADLLYHLLDVDGPRLEPVRRQVPHALVVDDSGLPFGLELRVPEGAAPPATDLPADRNLEATTLRTDDWMVSVRLWLEGGYLGSIEVDWYEEEPDRLPHADELRPAEWM
jgi:hypothetical protein